MIQDLYQKAINFAGEKHYRQKLPASNANYVLHLSNVAMEVFMAYNSAPNFDLNLAIQLAILHDTIEDTETSFEELKNKFGEHVAEGVLALTKNNTFSTKKERMLDSIERIKVLKKEVGLVKLADRITNLQQPPETWSKAKIKDYLHEAILLHSLLLDKNNYLSNRLKSKIEDYKKYTS